MLLAALLLSCHANTDAADTGADADTDTDTDTHTDTDTGTETAECTSACDCAGGELCYDGSCAAAGPALAYYRATLDRMLAAMDPTKGSFESESAYPTEALMTLASGAALLCDEELAAAAEVRADYARASELDDHVYYWSGYPYVTRDYNARHIYNLWAAGHALDDPELLSAADDVATAMMSLTRVEYNGFTLFCTQYYEEAPHACVDDATWIDDNQNSEIGLAFALLATDPESALYGDATALDIVDQELSAAISIQDPKTGAIPIGSEGGYEDDFDTLYGSYAAFSWTLAAPFAPAPDLGGPLSLASAWLAPLSDADPTSHRTYPYPYDGTISLSEGAMRIPLLSTTGALDPAFVDYYWGESVATNTETCSVFLPIWLMTNAGMPLADFLPPAE